MDYELYHDESKESGYWHGIFLVPTDTKVQLVDLLDKIRTVTGYEYSLAIKKVSDKDKIFSCARAWIQAGVNAMIQQKFISKQNPIYIRKIYKDGTPENKIIDDHGQIRAKFILFHDKDDHSNMSDYYDYGGKVETTFRIGLKGGLHFLGNQDDPINIIKMHFDGHEHYRRHIKREMIVDKMYGLREYCSFAENLFIDDRRSDHKKDNCQNYDDCQILQLTDLLVGSFRTILGVQTNELHRTVAHPISEIVGRYKEGYARMKNSRWFNGFCMSRCAIVYGKWVFEELDFIQDQNNKYRQDTML